MPDVDLPGIISEILSKVPSIEDIPDQLRVLMTIGLAGLLVLLRFDAERFNAAEYDDEDRWGNPPSLVRRLAWYTLGIAGVLLVMTVYPNPASDLFLGLGDRLGVVILGVTYGAIGTAVAIAIAMIRYRGVRLPPVSAYPGAVVNAVATAFIDEAIFRGIVFGLLLMTGIDANYANVIQALIYALATRLGAPGRPWYMLAGALGIGLAGGWLTGVTGGIGAAFLGHAITRVAVFVTTGHAAIPKKRGTEDEEVERRHEPPKGWQVLGPDEPPQVR
jgi:membrane protease YdiL (CAAX protease family)